LIVTVALALPAAHAWNNAGWAWRWDVPQPILDVVGNFKAVRNATWQNVRDTKKANPATFSPQGKEHIKVLLIGDSHSKDMFNAFHLNKELAPQLQVRRAPLAVWCMWSLANTEPTEDQSTAYRRNCKDQTQALLESETVAKADWIMLSLRWRTNSDEFIAGAFATLREHSNSRLVVFGRTPEFRDIPLLALEHGALEGLGELATSQRNVALDELNARLAATTLAEGAVYIDKLGWVCGQTSENCTVTDKDDQLLIYDVGHWTLAGAKHYGQRMFESGGLGALFQP